MSRVKSEALARAAAARSRASMLIGPLCGERSGGFAACSAGVGGTGARVSPVAVVAVAMFAGMVPDGLAASASAS